jgi:hypothetical protein
MYIVQNGSKIATEYWADGHIQILVEVKTGGTFIDSGLVRVYCREYGQTYADFAVDLSPGGETAAAITTSATEWTTLTEGECAAMVADLTITPDDLANVRVEPEELNYVDLRSMIERLKTYVNAGGALLACDPDTMKCDTEARPMDDARAELFGVARLMAVKTDAGENYTFVFEDQSTCLQVPPGEKTLEKHKALAKELAMVGTPQFVTETGTRISGFQQQALQEYLNPNPAISP